MKQKPGLPQNITYWTSQLLPFLHGYLPEAKYEVLSDALWRGDESDDYYFEAAGLCDPVNKCLSATLETVNNLI